MLSTLTISAGRDSFPASSCGSPVRGATGGGAVVVVASDGWERGDPSLLGEQMRRLSRLAHRVVWANPHRGKPGYAPVTGGMRVALPYVDDLVDGHALAARLLDPILSGATIKGRWDAARRVWLGDE